MRKGFTLVELLIVIAIIILLLVFVLINIRGQTAKAMDARRKSDLYTIHNALEEYYNDHGGYPPEGSLVNCGGTDFSPYLQAIPCDPRNESQYGYFLSPSVGGYRICAILADKTDPAITAIGCTAEGCGVNGSYNYCLSTGVPPSAIGSEEDSWGSTPTPIPTGAYACTPPDTQGVSRCNHYLYPDLLECTQTFQDNLCQGLCNNGAVPCVQ